MNRFAALQLSFAIVVIVLLAECQAELCPDHQKTCRKGQTCCDDKQGGFGCCPYENATCCSDGLHCCPEETSCDLSAGRCHRNGKAIKQVKLASLSSFGTYKSGFDADNSLFNGTLTRSGDKECPDQKSSCPSSYTCCSDPDGNYACCPFPNATCCSDKVHCCPQGRACNGHRCV